MLPGLPARRYLDFAQRLRGAIGQFEHEDPEADYIGICGLKWELKSNGNYSKRLDIKWNTREDHRVEG